MLPIVLPGYSAVLREWNVQAGSSAEKTYDKDVNTLLMFSIEGLGERSKTWNKLKEAMEPFLGTVNVFEVFMMSDIVGQFITAGLAIGSLITWTVMIGKHFELKRLRTLNHAFEHRLHEERTLLDRLEAFRSKRSIPYADLYTEAVDAYWRAHSILSQKGENSASARMEHCENAIQRAIARQVLRYESSMIFLATVVTGAPFLGLLGTVWGVMEAFTSVAGEQTASIRTLAPGVASALLTTVAGLVVAIPSVFGYNYLLGKTRELTTETENYASALADRIELENERGEYSETEG